MQFGLHPQIAALESMINPAAGDLITQNSLASSGTIEIAPAEAPLALFVWSAQRVVPVRVTEFSVTEEAFDPLLNPIRAKVSLGLRVLSVEDLGFSHKGGALFLGYLQRKEMLGIEGAGRRARRARHRRHSMTDALKTLDALLQSSAAGAAALSADQPLLRARRRRPLTSADGRIVNYLRRRFVPQPTRFALLKEHVVVQNDRLDNLAAKYIGDPEQYWRLCDANDAMRPDELIETIGRRLRITLPEGIPAPNAEHADDRQDPPHADDRAGVPVPAPAEVIDALDSVQVTSSAQTSGFQLTFEVGKKSLLLTTLLPAGYFDPIITRVIIIATVNGLPNVLMDGVVTRQELSPSNDVGKSTLTITGEDLSVLMDLVEMPFMRFPAMPDDRA